MSRKPKSIVGKKPTAAKEPEAAISNLLETKLGSLAMLLAIRCFITRLIKCQRLGVLSIALIRVAAGLAISIRAACDCCLDRVTLYAIQVFGTLPQFERELTRPAASKARAEGKYKGRAPTARAKADKVRELRETLALDRQRLPAKLASAGLRSIGF